MVAAPSRVQTLSEPNEWCVVPAAGGFAVKHVLGASADEQEPTAAMQPPPNPCKLTECQGKPLCAKCVACGLNVPYGVNVPPNASPDYTDEPWQDALLARATAAGFKRDAKGDWIVPGGLDTTELLALLSGLPLPERYARGVDSSIEAAVAEAQRVAAQGMETVQRIAEKYGLDMPAGVDGGSK